MSKKRFVYYTLQPGNPFGEHGIMDQKTNKPIATLHTKEGADKVLEAVTLVHEILTKETAPLVNAMSGIAAVVRDMIVTPVQQPVLPPPTGE